MSIPQGRQSARELVRSITRRHGYLAPEQYARIPDPDLRREIEEAILSKDQLIGSSVITYEQMVFFYGSGWFLRLTNIRTPRLARNLYSSRARFVFELLQNADDNCYERGQTPSVSFMVYRDRIVVDCNEDGFTEQNLTAICAVGASSKTGAQCYIGEKGIGFKSVFMVAWKVHIQSGDLSFSFTHQPGDSGMGMISPVWEDAADELASPLTRMTLYLLDNATEDGNLRQAILEQFSDIKETFLLFMRHIQQVSVLIYDESEREISRTSYKLHYQEGLVLNRARITKTTGLSGETSETSKLFHVCTYQATNLSKNENRTYSDREQESRAWSTSHIVLAFPLTDTEVPIVESQNLFVFLPVGPIGMKFIIQADFVTDANRQGIVEDSLRNHNLIDGIVEAYLKAILQLCEHPTLRYQWMRYLPNRDHQDRGRLWDSLVEKLAIRLAQKPIVFSHKSNSLSLMPKLSRLVPSTLDANDEPLFDDVFPETMLSRRYTASDAWVLREYGLPKVSWTQILIWIRHDLRQGARSRIRSSTSSDDWQTRVAKLLASAFDGPNEDAKEQLKGMELIPLSDGSWVSVSSSSAVYFPVIDDFEIPSKISLRIVDKSITNPERLALFKLLGVQRATVHRVRRCIFNEYSDTRANANVTLEESEQHLHFLIKTQHLADPAETGLEHLALYTTKGNQVRPRRNKLYLMNEDPLGPWELLRKTDFGPDLGDGAPGLERNFLHSNYLHDDDNEPERAQEWYQWLHEKLHVNHIISFEDTASRKGELSEEAEYLQVYRPEKFLGALHAWFESNERTVEPELIDALQDTDVLYQGGYPGPLHRAYFPTKGLKTRVERYVGPEGDFPWLWLGPDIPTYESVPRGWEELINVLELGNQLSDLGIALDMLRVSSAFLQNDYQPLSLSKEILERLLGLYQHVWSMLQEHPDRSVGETSVRSMFHDESNRLIYVPAKFSDERFGWTSAKHCVWNAPRLMVSKTVISLMWEKFLPQGLSFQHLEHFFTEVVMVAKCTPSIFVDELRELKRMGSEDIDAIRTWYEELNDLQQSSSTFLNDLKRIFEDEALIYAPSVKEPPWHKVSQCVWSNASRLRGKPSLNDEYEHLYDFFVGFLGVKPVDLGMAVDELREAGNEESSADVIRDSIWTVNSLLSATAEWPKSRQVTKSRIFPVRLPSDEVSCLSLDAEFFVIDREPYRRAFEHRVKLLDFTLAEVAELGPFLQWANLEDRYLSARVREIASFGGDDAVAILNSERPIFYRAHALTRIAKQYGSPRVRSISTQETFYELLRNTQIFGTDHISSDIQLQQDGRLYTERGRANAVFIREHESQLQVYLPRRRREQLQAFKIKLPRSFLEWMMADPDTQMREAISDKAIVATEHVFNSPRSMLEETLDEDGIADIEIENRDDHPDDDTDADSTAESDENLADVDHADSIAAAERQELMEQERNWPGYFEDDANTSSVSVEGVNTPFTTATSSNWRAAIAPSQPVAVSLRTRPILNVPSDDAEYSRLLDDVIRAARAAVFPQWSDREPAGSRLGGHNRSVQISASTLWERNCKIGAAGELFVFELLSNLGRQHEALPGFTISNWKSQVRKLARAHREYADLEPWDGVETSDIVYADEAGVLTTLLREKGYFEDLWLPSMEKPNYLIEVKTTTSDCGASFYMTGGQYALMQNSALVPWNGSNLYVVFRVFNLGQDNMGLQIYLDPERLRRQGKLIFTGEQWSVTPGSV